MPRRPSWHESHPCSGGRDDVGVFDAKGRRPTNYGITHNASLKEEEERIMKEEGVSLVYDVDELITWRVFGVLQGTVLRSRTLWLETCGQGVIYWLVFGGVLLFRFDGFSAVIGKESSIRAFIAMFFTLICLLLSFYTALNLNRWWQMRLAVQNIEEGCKELTMMVSQGCTQDEVLLETIHRYARASLYMIFATSQNQPGDECPRLKALDYGLLTLEEADNLEKLNPHMPFVQAETLWVWLTTAVTRLHNQGLTKGPPHYCALLAAVEQGRSGVSTVRDYLETPIPLGYVHLLIMMVKLHNVILTILMALSCVMLAGGAKGLQPLGMFRTSFRAFFTPFLYNAMLIINYEISDPFSNDEGDFSWSSMNTNIKMSAKSYGAAGKHLPDWIIGRKFPKLVLKSRQPAKV